MTKAAARPLLSVPLLSVVVPVLDEVEGLPALLAALDEAADGIEGGVEYVLVDDGSRDGSYARLLASLPRHPRLRAVRLVRNFGSHGACLAGLGRARGEHAAILAADLQDPPSVLPAMLAEARRGFAVVWGRREARADGLLTVLGARLYHRLMRALVFPNWPREGFDVVLLGRPVIDALVARPERDTSLFGRILWLGFAQTSVGYRRGPRRHGRSKWTLAKKLRLVLDSVVSFSGAPVRLAWSLGLLCLAGAVAGAALLAALRLGGVLSGLGTLAPLALLVLGLGGLQMIVLGAIGEYAVRALDQARGRPAFLVAEAAGFDAEPMEAGR